MFVFTSDCPHWSCRCSGVCTSQPWSSSSFPSQSASCLSSAQPRKFPLVTTVSSQTFTQNQIETSRQTKLPSAVRCCSRIPCCSGLSSSWLHPQPSCGRRLPPSSAAQPVKEMITKTRGVHFYQWCPCCCNDETEGAAHLSPGLALFIPLSTNPLLLGSFSSTLLLEIIMMSEVWCMTLIQQSAILRFYSYNSLFEGNEFLLFLLPALKVSVDQRLQLNQVFVLTFLLDVLPAQLGEGCLQGWGFWIKTVLGSRGVKPATQWTLPDLLNSCLRLLQSKATVVLYTEVKGCISLKIMWRKFNFTFQSMLFYVHDAQIVFGTINVDAVSEIQWCCERFLWSVVRNWKSLGGNVNPKVSKYDNYIIPLQNRGLVRIFKVSK